MSLDQQQRSEDVTTTTNGDSRSLPVTFLFAALAGLVIGPIDLALQRLLPYPWANLANSSAVWAVLAFAVGWWWGGRRWWQPAATAVFALLIAVETYYLAAVIVLGDDLATLYNATARLWLVLAVLAGVVFGTMGSWARRGNLWLAPIGTATGASVLLAEALLDLFRAAAAEAARATDLRQTALIVAVLGAVMLVLSSRSPRQAWWAAGFALVLTGLGFAAFVVLDFG